MEYLNITYLISVFLIPASSFLFLCVRSEQKRDSQFRIVGLVTYLLLFVFTLVRIVTLTEFDRASYVISGISFSRELDFALAIDRERLLVLCGISYFVFNKYFHTSVFSIANEKKLLSYFYILFTYVSAAVSVLSEKILVSVMFIELTLFSLHAYSLLSDEIGRSQEAVSYFKRNVFIFGGLFLMLGISLLKFFDNNFILATGVTLYSLSIICGRHTYRTPTDIMVQMFTQFCAAFIFWRVFQLDISLTDKILNVIIFLFISLIFLISSFFSAKKISALYWYSMGMLCSIFALKMSSKNPGSINLLFFDILMTLQFLNSFLLSAVLKGWPRKEKLFKNYFTVVILFSSHLFQLILPLTLLGGALAAEAFSAPLFATYVLIVFLSTAAYSKFCFGERFATTEGGWWRVDEKPRWLSAVNGVIYIALSIFVATGRMLSNEAGVPVTSEPFFSSMSLVELVLLAAAVVFGLLSGIFLPKTNWFNLLLKKNEQGVVVELAPTIDPKFISVGIFLVQAPLKTMDWIVSKNSQLITAVSMATLGGEKKIVRNFFLNEVRSTVASISMFVRYLHSGFLQFYILFGAITMFVIALYFVFWGGK